MQQELPNSSYIHLGVSEFQVIITSLAVGSQVHFWDVHAVAPELDRMVDALIRHDIIAATWEHASPNL